MVLEELRVLYFVPKANRTRPAQAIPTPTKPHFLIVPLRGPNIFKPPQMLIGKKSAELRSSRLTESTAMVHSNINDNSW